MNKEPPQPSSKALRPLYLAAGLALTAIGIAGVILPLLPGTVFLILAAACFARSSPRFETWLITHPKFGPSVVAWRRSGAIPLKAKVVAISAMAVSFVIVVVSHAPLVAQWATGACLAAAALFVGTRPGVPPTDVK